MTGTIISNLSTRENYASKLLAKESVRSKSIKSDLRSLTDRLENYPTDPSSYKIQSSTITCWLDYREREEVDKEKFTKVYHELSSCGAVIAQIGFLDSSHFAKSTVKANYFYEIYLRFLQDQNFALVLEPSTEEGEWKRIGVARIADDFKDGWEAREFCIV